LAAEYRDQNINVNCLALGSVQTGMFEEAFPGLSAQFTIEQMAEYIVDYSKDNLNNKSGEVIPVSNATP
jgi:short-subunit dehydrogenase